MEIEIFEYNGEGYNPTMHYGEWRVAFLNYAERYKEPDTLERHMLTDEVFVLLSGEAVLITDKSEYVLEPYKIYNVKKGVWHCVKANPDTKLLIVENHNTSKDNSQYMPRKQKL